jgi:hypothetical protein
MDEKVQGLLNSPQAPVKLAEKQYFLPPPHRRGFFKKIRIHHNLDI